MRAGGGGRNKEPSKHGESVWSKAHKYSSRVLISPTHTRARRNTARAPAATQTLAERQSPKLLLQTVRGCTRVGAAGRRDTLTPTPGRAHGGSPPGTLGPADPSEKEKTPGSSPTGPRPCPGHPARDCTRGGWRGSPAGSRSNRLPRPGGRLPRQRPRHLPPSRPSGEERDAGALQPPPGPGRPAAYPVARELHGERLGPALQLHPGNLGCTLRSLRPRLR